MEQTMVGKRLLGICIALSLVALGCGSSGKAAEVDSQPNVRGSIEYVLVPILQGTQRVIFVFNCSGGIAASCEALRATVAQPRTPTPIADDAELDDGTKVRIFTDPTNTLYAEACRVDGRCYWVKPSIVEPIDVSESTIRLLAPLSDHTQAEIDAYILAWRFSRWGRELFGNTAHR